MINRILHILFPETCPACSQTASDHRTAPICADCWNTISRYAGTVCRICGTPLPSDSGRVCGSCIKDAPVFTSARSFGIYEGPLRKAIGLLKYHGIKRLAGPLSDIIMSIDMPEADAVMAVPLHVNRLRERGYNQSALMAKRIARHMNISFEADCLIKVRDTLPQVGLHFHERMKNIKGAFTVRDSRPVRGKDVILVDDVVTTGSTIRECARILKQAGAANIYAVSLAHGINY